jgi:hypothetical protein
MPVSTVWELAPYWRSIEARETVDMLCLKAFKLAAGLEKSGVFAETDKVICLAWLPRMAMMASQSIFKRNQEYCVWSVRILFAIDSVSLTCLSVKK